MQIGAEEELLPLLASGLVGGRWYLRSIWVRELDRVVLKQC